MGWLGRAACVNAVNKRLLLLGMPQMSCHLLMWLPGAGEEREMGCAAAQKFKICSRFLKIACNPHKLNEFPKQV